MITTKITKKCKGRPKCFDRQEALEKAKNIFCYQGYQGTSIAQLTESMGIKPPSLYAEFGDKEKLFIEVLDSYYAPYKEEVNRIFKEQKTTDAAFKSIFDLSKSFHTQGIYVGCLIVNSSINSFDEDTLIGAKLKEIHNENECRLCERIDKGKIDGDVASHVDTKRTARYVNGVLAGAAVIARGQKSSDAVKDLLEQGFISFKSIIKP